MLLSKEKAINNIKLKLGNKMTVAGKFYTKSKYERILKGVARELTGKRN